VALVVGSTRWTWAALRDAVDRAAGWLQAQGLHRGQRILLQGPREPGWLALHLAAIRLGIATAPMNDRATAEETRRWLQAIDPDLALLHGEGRAWTDGNRHWGAREALDAASTHAPSSSWDGTDDDVVLLGATSGTTGAAKPVPLRARHLSATVDGLRQAWAMTQDDVLLHVLPLFHIHGLVVAQHLALAVGARTVWRPRFDPDDTVQTMRREGVTVFMAVPTLYHRLLQRPDLDLPDTLRLCTSGSAPLSADDHQAFATRTGVGIVERYGMTEVGIVLTNDPAEPVPGSVGRPVPGATIRVVDAEGQPVAPGEVGEILVQGPSVFEGYEGRPDATAQALKDGWMHTGDLATIDGAGRVHIRGRRSALVITGGFNVYPGEVEAVLARQPGVQAAAVVGLADPDLGQVPVASVVGQDLDASTLQAACRDALSAYKVPRHIALVDALPRNAMGKLQRGTLSQSWSDTRCREAREDEAGRLAAWNRAMAAETEDLSLDPGIAQAGVVHGMARGEARYVVAERGGGCPVGQLMLTTEWSDWRDAQVWWIQSVYVPPAWRRRGVLRSLFDHVEQMAHQAGVAGLRLYVDKTNTRAQAAYRRLGWDDEHYTVFERMLPPPDRASGD